ncbi:hypothetical protein CPB85DRAFT_1344896 [Mucidula mucida]|nr:hypothetical protein CPB85DRAFT_1344896 [Mucidula mucida]
MDLTETRLLLATHLIRFRFLRPWISTNLWKRRLSPYAANSSRWRLNAASTLTS